MSIQTIQSLLSNYAALVKKIDDHIDCLQKTYADEIACKKGCDNCCKHLTLFPVEAICLAASYSDLGTETRQQIMEQIRNAPGECPLLVNHACVLYGVRPVICRTHGYPVTMEKQGELAVDFCPKNFNTIVSFKDKDLLSLEQLNKTLSAVNQHFLSTIETDSPLPGRITVADAIFLLE